MPISAMVRIVKQWICLVEQLSEEKTSNLSEKEFRVMIVKNDPRFQKKNGGMD